MLFLQRYFVWHFASGVYGLFSLNISIGRRMLRNLWINSMSNLQSWLLLQLPCLPLPPCSFPSPNTLRKTHCCGSPIVQRNKSPDSANSLQGRRGSLVSGILYGFCWEQKWVRFSHSSISSERGLLPCASGKCGVHRWGMGSWPSLLPLCS